MQITNLYNKEGSLEDARPKSPLPGSATPECEVAAATAPVDLTSSLPQWFGVAINIAAIAVIVMAAWARLQQPLLAWWSTNATTPSVMAFAASGAAPAAVTAFDQFIVIACCSLTAVLVLHGARTVYHRLTTTATARDGTIVSMVTKMYEALDAHTN